MTRRSSLFRLRRSSGAQAAGGQGEQPASTRQNAAYTALVHGLKRDLAREMAQAEVREFVAAAQKRFEGRFVAPRWSWEAWAPRLAVAAALVAATIAGAWLVFGGSAPRWSEGGAYGPSRFALVPESPSGERTPPPSLSPPKAAAALAPPRSRGAEVPLPPVAEPRLRVDSVSGRASPSTPNVVVHTGQRVQTASDGQLRLVDEQTAVVDVESSTALSVATWDGQRATIELDSGEITSRVRRRVAGQSYEVHTPYAVVSVVGTVFSVEHRPGRETIVRCAEGRVNVSTRDGRALGAIGAGESLRVAPPRVLAGEGVEPQGAAEREASVVAAERRVAEQEVRAVLRAPLLGPSGGSGGRAVAERPVLQKTSSASPRPSAKDSGLLPGAVDALAPSSSAEEPGGEPASSRGGTPSALRPEADVLAEGRRMLARSEDAAAIALWMQYPAKGWRTWAALGDAYKIGERWREARDAYEAALAASQGQPAAGAVIADLAAVCGEGLRDAERAASLWRRYLDEVEDGPEAPQALWSLALFDAAHGRVDAAKSSLRTLLSRHDEHRLATRAMVRLGRMLLDEQEWGAARELFESQRTARAPDRVEAALIGLARVHVATRQPERARQLLSDYRERFPNGARQQEALHIEQALPQSALP